MRNAIKFAFSRFWRVLLISNFVAVMAFSALAAAPFWVMTKVYDKPNTCRN